MHLVITHSAEASPFHLSMNARELSNLTDYTGYDNAQPVDRKSPCDKYKAISVAFESVQLNPGVPCDIYTSTESIRSGAMAGCALCSHFFGMLTSDDQRSTQYSSNHLHRYAQFAYIFIDILRKFEA